MPRIRVVTAVTPEPACRRLRTLLEQAPDVELLPGCASGAELLALVRAHAPDLAFLDVPLRDAEGLGVLEQLRAARRPPLCVLVAPHGRHAVHAFESGVLDYLLTSFTEARLGQALERARTRLHERHVAARGDRLLALLQTSEPREASRPAADSFRPVSGETTLASPEKPAERLILKTGGRYVFVDPDEVDWVEAEGVYVRLHVGSKSYLLRERIKNVEACLDPGRFLRIHRSTVVNAGRIREIVPQASGGAIVVLRDQTRLKLSRSYRHRVTATLG